MRDRYLWWGCAFYAALLTYLGWIKYAAHRNLVDFGIFAQTASSAFGCFCNPLEGSHWAFHFSPVLYVVGIAVAFAHSPITIIALQSIAAAFAAPPVYAMVRARGDVGLARLAALVVLLYPPLAGLAFGDFHENNFAPAAVAWALYAFDAGKLLLAGIAIVVTLATKEDQAIFLAFAGGAGAYVYRNDGARRTFALTTVAAGVIVAIAFFALIQPHANANPSWQPTRFYSWSGGDFAALVPRGLLERLGFLLMIFAPLAFLPLRTRAIVLAIPPLLEVLLSRMNATFTLGSHYAGAWMGYVFFAFAVSIRELNERNVKVHRALYWAIGLCVVELLVANPMHPGLNLRARQNRDALLDDVLTRLPSGVSVATQEEAYTHLALDDPYARLLPELPTIPTRACLVLVDRDFPESPRLQEYGGALQELVLSGDYVLADRIGGVEIYRSAAACR